MNELAARGHMAARSAHRLLEDGDYASAVSRAYYAMFDLTRAMLQELDPKLVAAKTHTTIISRFSKHLVRDRGLPSEAGRVLRRVFNARILTEYSASAVTLKDAREAVELMDRFFEAVARQDTASDE